MGPAPTQKQNFPVPARAVMQWTEWIKGFRTDEEALRSADYTKGLRRISDWIRSDEGFNQRAVADVDAFFESIAEQRPDELLVTGQPWGALQEQLLGQPLTKGLVFTMPDASAAKAAAKAGAEADFRAAEAQPWKELLADGTFSAASLQLLPVSYQTTDLWLRAIEASAEEHSSGMTWLHALHMGVAYTERGEVDRPRELFLKSMALRPNPIAARCLAVLSQNAQEAWPYYQLAWQLSQEEFAADVSYERLTVNLVSEMSFFLQQEQWYDAMARYAQEFQSALAALPSAPSVDALITMAVKVQLHQQQYDDAITVLGAECFPTYAKARADLMDMWNEAVEGRAAQQKQQQLEQLSAKERHQARMQSPIPDNIGCEYASEYCINYW